MPEYPATSKGYAAILLSGWMQDEMVQRAEAGADIARSLAAESRLTGNFQNSIHVERGIERDRVAGLVVSDDPAASHIEFGTRDTDGVRVFTRTVDIMRAGVGEA
jgi:hypothetical protein